ncbi:MAG: hypothetical protein RIT50_671 [Bacteroidota bacterium]|jgi:hypothetical protein
MNLETLRTRIEPLRQQIVQHELYTKINTIEAIRVFMQHHVVAVWDFMSLLKSLQRELTCVSNPWLPVGSANTRYLINEIVTGEESDVDQAGNRISHFELYLKAMEQAGANKLPIQELIASIQTGTSVEQALATSSLPDAAKRFAQHTFDLIEKNQPHILAAVFTFGREDLIPDMFLSILNKIEPGSQYSIDLTKYYIERHIEVDGGHHSQLALEMTQELCGNDAQKWQEASAAVEKALASRVALWDGALSHLN